MSEWMMKKEESEEKSDNHELSPLRELYSTLQIFKAQMTTCITQCSV